MKKIAIFAFNGDPMCFVHVLLNALEMNTRGWDVKLIIEGSATKLVPNFAEEKGPFADLYRQVREAGLIDCVCKACSSKMGVLSEVEKQGLPVCAELKGHPSMYRYVDAGFEIMTF